MQLGEEFCRNLGRECGKPLQHAIRLIEHDTGSQRIDEGLFILASIPPFEVSIPQMRFRLERVLCCRRISIPDDGGEDAVPPWPSELDVLQDLGEGHKVTGFDSAVCLLVQRDDDDEEIREENIPHL